MWCFLAMYKEVRTGIKFTREIQFFDMDIFNEEAFKCAVNLAFAYKKEFEFLESVEFMYYTEPIV